MCPADKQGTALGIFGAGNVGAAVTNFAAPFLVIALGWEDTARVYAIVLIAMAIIFYIFAKEDPVRKKQKVTGAKPASALKQLEPLKDPQVWRFATYYFFVFGGFVAFASFLPRYYVGAYGVALTSAGLFAGMYSLPGSIFRALGGWGRCLGCPHGDVSHLWRIADRAVCYELPQHQLCGAGHS